MGFGERALRRIRVHISRVVTAVESRWHSSSLRGLVVTRCADALTVQPTKH